MTNGCLTLWLCRHDLYSGTISRVDQGFWPVRMYTNKQRPVLRTGARIWIDLLDKTFRTTNTLFDKVHKSPIT